MLPVYMGDAPFISRLTSKAEKPILGRGKLHLRLVNWAKMGIAKKINIRGFLIGTYIRFFLSKFG